MVGVVAWVGHVDDGGGERIANWPGRKGASVMNCSVGEAGDGWREI